MPHLYSGARRYKYNYAATFGLYLDLHFHFSHSVRSRLNCNVSHSPWMQQSPLRWGGAAASDGLYSVLGIREGCGRALLYLETPDKFYPEGHLGSIRCFVLFCFAAEAEERTTLLKNFEKEKANVPEGAFHDTGGINQHGKRSQVDLTRRALGAETVHFKTFW